MAAADDQVCSDLGGLTVSDRGGTRHYEAVIQTEVRRLARALRTNRLRGASASSEPTVDGQTARRSKSFAS
jgi:hypothetical protein